MVRVKQTEDDIKDHETRLRKIEDLMPTIRIIIGVCGALGLSIIALIWSMITGQVSLLFK